MTPPVSLREFDKIEWYDICRAIHPTLTWEEYEAIWEKYLIARNKKLDTMN